jgi:flagellar hook-basal body complex protein FliE
MNSVSNHYQSQVADLLSQIRAQQSRNDLVRSDSGTALSQLVQSAEQTSSKGFGNLMVDALNDVNETSHASMILKNAYEKGEDIPLTDVVLAMQKASIGFEATLQVRNKLVRAYEDIKNMPV